jgi:hypothetical protein
MKINIDFVGADMGVRPAENQIQWLKTIVSRFGNVTKLLVTGRTQGSPIQGMGNGLVFRRGDACHRPAIQHFLYQNTIKRVVSRFA